MVLRMKNVLFAALGAQMLFTAPLSAAELVMFEEPGCFYCLRWKHEIGPIYHNTEQGRQAPLRMVDLHGDWPADLRFVRGVTFTPTFVLIDEGREVGRMVGYPAEHCFWPLLHDMLMQLPAQGAAIQ